MQTEIAHNGSRKFHGYTIVIIALLIIILTHGSRYAFGIFFKPVLTEFSWTRAATSGAFALSLMINGLLGIVMGGLTDKLGPRIILTICGLITGAGYLLMSQMNELWQLYLFYGVVVGIGMGGIWVPLLSTIARWFIKRRSLMTGIALTGTGVGMLILSPLSNWLISVYDWRFSYIVLGAVILVVIVSCSQLLKRDPGEMGEVPDGYSSITNHQQESKVNELSLTDAAHTRQLWIVFAMFICFGIAMFSVIVHVAAYITDLGISASVAANVLAVMGGLNITGRIAMGVVADRIGNRRSLIIGFILLTSALVLLIATTEIWMFYLFAIIFGFAFGGMGVCESPLIARLFGLSSHGIIFGILNFGFTIGSAAGPLFVGYIFDITESYHFAFLVLVTISIIGLILTILIKPVSGNRIL